MDDPDFRAAATAAAGLLELAIDPALLEGVAANLALLHRHAGAVMAFRLDDDVEGAPVFRP